MTQEEKWMVRYNEVMEFRANYMEAMRSYMEVR